MQDHTHVPGISESKAGYMLYAYQNYDPYKVGHNKWECLTRHKTKEDALRHGSLVFGTNLYQKIEIKEKAYDFTKRKHVLKTHHVWKHDLPKEGSSTLKQKKAIYWGMALIALLAIVLLIL